MKNETKILLAVIVTALLTFFLTREFTGYEVVGMQSDTTKTTTTKITRSENIFTAIQVGKIKRILMDSLDAVYRDRLEKQQSLIQPRQAITGEKPEHEQEQDHEQDSGYAYVSEIDTSFIEKDSTGFVTDSSHIKAVFVSDEPLPLNSFHAIYFEHVANRKETETTTTINTKDFIEPKKSWLQRFQIRPNVSAGVGLFTKTFDIYAGVGISYEL